MLKHHFAYKWLKTITPKVKNAKTAKNLEKRNEIPSNRDIQIVNDYIKKNLDKILKSNIEVYSEYLNLCRLVLYLHLIKNYLGLTK